MNDQLFETLLLLIDEYITANIVSMKNEDFDKELYLSIKSLYTIPVSITLKDALCYFFTYIMPRRSYKTTFIRNVLSSNIGAKLEKLKNIPQPAQRTSEWYEFRHNHLTASSIWKVFGTNSQQNQLIYSKCNTLSKQTTPSIYSTLHWGHKYEPVSTMWYEETYKTKVDDFGCIPHEKYDFIAASPDGINVRSKRIGRMLEIKNIVNREITGIPKMEYWIQMQVQMEVCELNECDFLETHFVEYQDKEEFDEDSNGEFLLSKDNKKKGIMLFFMDNEEPIYQYAPINMTEKEFTLWENNTREKCKHLEFVKNIYWKLNKVSCILVLRNKYWFSGVIDEFTTFWNTIQREKVEGFAHRAPKKRVNPLKNNCIIQIPEMTGSINTINPVKVIHVDTEKITNTSLSML